MEPDETTVDEDTPDVTIEPTHVATARRRYGIGGAMMAGGMLGIEKALELRPAKEEAPIVVASPSEPIDVDNDGIDVDIDDETWAYAPPQPRSKPHVKPVRGRR